MKYKKLIVGNWKMNPGKLSEARSIFLSIKKESLLYKNVEAVIAAPFVYLPELSKSTSSALMLSAQNISSEKEGAFTGEVSAPMVYGQKVKYTIVGHSERRTLGETNEQICKKIKLALTNKLIPILCVGENERDHGMWYLSTVKTQIEECLLGIPKSAIEKIIIAYEPVWALSSTVDRRDATPVDFEEMRIYIRKVISDIAGAKTADSIRVLYGGSVDEKNAEGFLGQGKADGLLVGRASLTAKKFSSIIKIASTIS